MEILDLKFMYDFKFYRQVVGGAWYKVLTFGGLKPTVKWQKDTPKFSDKLIRKEEY
jgi:hypothetical protein